VQPPDGFPFLAGNNKAKADSGVLALRQESILVPRRPQSQDPFHLAMCLPHIGRLNVIEIGNLTLVHNERTKTFILEKAPDLFDLIAKPIADWFKSRIGLTPSHPAPIVDEAIGLNLYELSSSLVKKPHARQRWFLLNGYVDSRFRGWQVERLDHGLKRRMFLNERQSLTEALPKEAHMRSRKPVNRLKLQRQNGFRQRRIAEIRQILGPTRSYTHSMNSSELLYLNVSMIHSL
jgi:hypothetical protein